MVLEIKAPSPSESISEVELANWLVEDGGQVEKDQEIAEIESRKSYCWNFDLNHKFSI